MSRLEETKTFIDLLKVLIVTLLVGMFGMIAHLVANLHTITDKQTNYTFAGIVIVAIILIILFKIIMKKIRELRDL